LDKIKFKESSVEILICTDGSDSSLQSAELISKLGIPADSKIVALGVEEKKGDVEKLSISMDLLDKKISRKYSITRKIRKGNPSEEILAEAIEHQYDLVALGGGGQLGILHPSLGSTTSKLARKLHTHFLVARNIPEAISKILICVGEETAPSETITLGGAWIANADAQIGLLHVVAPQEERSLGSKNDGLLSDLIRANDQMLDRASQQLRYLGVKNKITTHVRQGLVVEEVINELSIEGFELMVIGAHYQPGQDRWKGTLFDDIADQLLNRSSCSVLII
jgi:nucleotide-binding universal stress UspA family protein